MKLQEKNKEISNLGTCRADGECFFLHGHIPHLTDSLLPLGMLSSKR